MIQTEDPIESSIGVLASLRRGWVGIALLTLAGIIVGAIVAFAVPARYEASSDVFFSVRAGNSLNELSQGNQFVESRMRSYASVVASPIVLQPVIEALDLDLTVEELARDISAEAQLDTVLMTITATADGPEEAAAIADATVASLAIAVVEIEQAGREGVEGAPSVALTVTRAAEVPTSPSSPNKMVFALLGAVLGLAGGVVVAIWRGRVDDSVISSADVRAALPQLPVVAELPRVEGMPGVSLSSAVADAIGEARTLLLARLADREQPTLLVTSSQGEEGRTTVATTLALSIAATGKRVCLVDADLRHPGIADRLDLGPGPGLADVLGGGAAIADVVRTADVENLSVITAGSASGSGADLLASVEMHRFLRGLQQHGDVVIVDGPGLDDGPGALILAEAIGAAVLVARSRIATRRSLATAVDRLASVNARPLGTVFNTARLRGRRRPA